MNVSALCHTSSFARARWARRAQQPHVNPGPSGAASNSSAACQQYSMHMSSPILAPGPQQSDPKVGLRRLQLCAKAASRL